MLAPLDPARDLRLSGQVIYTGRSSMEVAVKMETIGMDQTEETVLLGMVFPIQKFTMVISNTFAGRFSMVCRDANTHRARQVNPLVISTPEEHALHSMGECAYCLSSFLAHAYRQLEVIKQKRQLFDLRSLSRVPPSSAEAEALHSFYLSFGQGGDTATVGDSEKVWMGGTRLEKCMLMFPQERKSVSMSLTLEICSLLFSVHQKVFGGYLMRLAYEVMVIFVLL
jgi:acyl-coenzyme A thioesterase 9